MSAFLKQVEEIFAVARRARAEASGELAILVGTDGAIHVLEAPDWELERLRAHHGARAAYLVSRRAGRVRLEARTASEYCRLEGLTPAAVLRPAIDDYPHYQPVAEVGSDRNGGLAALMAKNFRERDNVEGNSATGSHVTIG